MEHVPEPAWDLTWARYISLTTFRKSGAEVATPVWAAFEQGHWYVFSAAGAGKVKRLRNDSRARIAVCDVRGRLLGEPFDATAELLQDPADIHRALLLLRRKYGLQMRLADAGARLTGRFDRRAYIRVKLADSVYAAHGSG